MLMTENSGELSSDSNNFLKKVIFASLFFSMTLIYSIAARKNGLWSVAFIKIKSEQNRTNAVNAVLSTSSAFLGMDFVAYWLTSREVMNDSVVGTIPSLQSGSGVPEINSSSSSSEISRDFGGDGIAGPSRGNAFWQRNCREYVLEFFIIVDQRLYFLTSRQWSGAGMGSKACFGSAVAVCIVLET